MMLLEQNYRSRAAGNLPLRSQVTILTREFVETKFHVWHGKVRFHFVLPEAEAVIHCDPLEWLANIRDDKLHFPSSQNFCNIGAIKGPNAPANVSSVRPPQFL
jgi:hypothetical protein